MEHRALKSVISFASGEKYCKCLTLLKRLTKYAGESVIIRNTDINFISIKIDNL